MVSTAIVGQELSLLAERTALPEGAGLRFAGVSGGQAARRCVEPGTIDSFDDPALARSVARAQANQRAQVGEAQGGHFPSLAAHLVGRLAAETCLGGPGLGIRLE